MKFTVKHIVLLALAIASLTGCKRFDPEERIVHALDMPQCLTPVSVKTTVLYNDVTFDLKVFPDAEKYVLEIYRSAIYDDVEPSESDLVERYDIDPRDIPYTISTLEDVTLYYRISATNESAGKTQSFWTTGRFKTSINPARICLTPEPEVTVSNDLIRFNWQKVLTDKYLLEVYTSAIPSSGEPDEADLYKSIELTNDDLPYSEVFPSREGAYYFRVKAMDLAGERLDSKWAKGRFTSTAYVWPNDEEE